MSDLPKFNFSQQRGAWLATCNSPRCHELFGTDIFPVMRDFRDGQWDWKARTFVGRPDAEDGIWWMLSKHQRWRDLLKAGVPVLVRIATPPTPTDRTGSVGRKIGIFKIADLILSEDQMSFCIVSKLSEAE